MTAAVSLLKPAELDLTEFVQDIYTAILPVPESYATSADMHWLALTGIMAMLYGLSDKNSANKQAHYGRCQETIHRKLNYVGLNFHQVNLEALLTGLRDNAINKLTGLGVFDPLHPIPVPDPDFQNGHSYDLRENANSQEWAQITVVRYVATRNPAENAVHIKPTFGDPWSYSLITKITKNTGLIPLKNLRPPLCYAG